MNISTNPRPAKQASGNSSLYRAVWRWHFYAGLLILPFMVLMAVTGAAYIYRDEIDDWYHADLKFVETANTAPLSMADQIESATRAVPGVAAKVTPPASPDRSSEIVIKTDHGREAVYVDPYRGTVLGHMPDRTTLMWTVRHIHSLVEFGTIPNYIIEIASGWAILLVLTGMYLWWPRKDQKAAPNAGQKGGVVTLRETPKRRIWWRDAHAVTGLFIGIFILFMAGTGMFWSVFWGKYANQFANGTPNGYPSGVRVEVPLSTVPMIDAFGDTSWTNENIPLPQSVDGGNVATANASTTAPANIGIDQAIAKFDELGLTRGYTVVTPGDETGVYSASIYPDDLSLQRVIHLDQYSGRPLIDMSYDDYGPFGKLMEWSINVHMGQEYGILNQIALLIVCALIVFMSVAAGVMWWKRRPSGKLGVPPLPRNSRSLGVVTAILAIGGIIYPTVGASMIVIAVLDYLLVARPARKRRRTAAA
ncbi:PepSY domain-containing protein [Thalassospira sp. MA62]|nr:PepSY domain-containing protein [Thalassospira sp. MA62]